MPFTFCGVEVKSRLMNASGCRSSTIQDLISLDQNPKIGIIISKTATFRPRKGEGRSAGARIVVIKDKETVNCIGLSNPGYHYYINASKVLHKPFMISLHADSVFEMGEMLREINSECPFPTFIEWNVSCPNVEGGDWKAMLPLISEMIPNLSNLIVGVKLQWVANVQEIAELLKPTHLKFLTCCNTLPNALIIENGEIVRGGLSRVKALSLANVYDYSRVLNLEIIGCGGICDARDVEEYLLCGATCVQVGTEYLKDSEIFAKL